VGAREDVRLLPAPEAYLQTDHREVQALMMDVMMDE
jgi:hypothetical protein